MLSIAVLHYNNDALTDECIRSLSHQQLDFPHEIYVVDNGSSRPYKNSYLPNKIYRYRENRGIACGINRCFKEAKYEWVLFVSNDVRFMNSDAILRLFRQGHRDSVQAMPLIRRTDGSIDCCGMNYVWPGYGKGWRSWSSISPKTFIIPNITFLCYKHLWEGAGKFDETMTEIGYEDVDFGLRLRGPKIVVPEAVAVHLGNQTFKESRARHRESYRKNRRYVVAKHFRGFDRWLRLRAMDVLDAIRAIHS